MGLGVPAIKSVLNRARVKLKENLTPDLDQGYSEGLPETLEDSDE